MLARTLPSGTMNAFSVVVRAGGTKVIIDSTTLFFWDADDPQGGEAFDEVAFDADAENTLPHPGQRTVCMVASTFTLAEHLGHCCDRTVMAFPRTKRR